MVSGGRGGSAAGAGAGPDTGKARERTDGKVLAEEALGAGLPSEFDMADMDRYFRSHSPAPQPPPPLPPLSVSSAPFSSAAPGDSLRRPPYLQHLHNHHNHPA